MLHLNCSPLLFRCVILLIFITAAHTSARAQELTSCATSRMATAQQRHVVATPEHQQLMNMYDITFYKLDLHLERNSVYIAGNVSIAALVKNTSLHAFAFELHPNFQIDSILINGTNEQNIIRNAGDVTVQLNNTLSANTSLTATVYYKGYAPAGNTAAIGNGFNTATERQWGNQVTWSLSEPYAAYEWWPTKQVLTDKADSVHVFVTTSAENKVGSNGVLTNVVDLPGHKTRYEWKSRYPIDYYLVSVAVSNYEEYLQHVSLPGIATPVPILNYVYSGGALSTYKTEIDRTPGFIQYFSGLFGLYPFHREKYGHSMAPMGGGMEHQTMTTQSTFTFTLTAHELAHQWFGDNVTCASWQDIWLNEGFASYAEYLALEQFDAALANQWMRDAHFLALQRPSGSVKVLDTLHVSRIFDFRLSYKKGASVVHMLRHEINNDALFYQALRNYQQTFGGATATTADLQRVAEQTTGKDLNYFFDQWYAGEGYPNFNVRWNQENNRLMLAIRQHGSGGTKFFKTDMEYKIITTAGDTTIRVTHTQPIQSVLLQVSGTVTGIEADPNNWVLEQSVVARDVALKVPAVGDPILYPNPTGSNALQVANLKFHPTHAAIYDLSGRKVKELNIAPAGSAVTVLDITALPAGAYYLVLKGGTGTYRSRFVRL